MLALVTCHIFPPSIWYGKKWIPGTWLPGWQLAVFQSPRLHERGPADAHGNAQLFCMDKCIFRKKRLFCNLATRWNKILQFVPSFPIYGWLTWWCDFFPVGPAFEDHPQVFSQKSAAPWILFLTRAPRPLEVTFFGWWSWTYVVVPLLQGQMYCQKKKPVLQFGRVGTKFLNSSHHVLSVDDWPGDATFFLWGQPLKIIRKYSVKKRSSPLDFIFDPCASASSSHFFGWWRWTYVFVPLLQGQMYCQKKKPVLQFGRVDTKFLNSSHHVLSVDDWPGDATFFLWGQPLKIIRKYSVKKVRPLGFYFWHVRLGLLKSPFLVGEAEHMWLYPFCKDKCIVRKKSLFCNLGALAQNSWIRPIMSYLWMIGLEMWLFSCGASLWRLSASIQSKKGPAPWILFLTPAPRPLQVTFLVGEGEHMCLYPFARTNVLSEKKACFAIWARWHKILEFVPSCPICGWLAWRCDFFPVGPAFEDYPQVFRQKKVQPLGFYFWPLRLGLFKSLFWLVKVNICVCTLLQSYVKNHTPSINHGTFFSWGLTFRYVLVNSHLIHPPSNSWLLTLGILQTYPLSESFMIDFLMPYIHRLIDQPPLNHNRQKLISCHCTSGSFQGKKMGLFWYDILFLAPYHAPGPSPTVC